MLKYAFDDPNLFTALRDHEIDAIVCAVSSDTTLSQLPLIDAAVKGGVKHFIPTEVSSSLLFPTAITLSIHVSISIHLRW